MKQKPLLPAYLALGEDALKRDKVVKRLRDRLSLEGDIAFNCDEFKGEAVIGSEVVSACNTLPFASSLRLVLLNDADKLKKDDAEALVEYLQSPSPTTVLLLCAEKLAKNTRLYKAIAKLDSSAIIDCAPPKAAALPAKVREMATAYGITFSAQAATKLVELVGENTVRLNTEIQKIALATGETGQVGEREVEQLVSRTSEMKPWNFLDAFCARNLEHCIFCLNHMESLAPLALITMCAARIRELICAKSLEARGRGHELAKTLKMPDWRIKNHRAWARNFSSWELRRALIVTRDADRAMKSGADAHEVLIDWTLAIVPRKP